MLKPRKNKVILEELKDDKQSEYGILISKNTKKTELIKAVVRAIDPTTASDVKEGDIVYIGHYQGKDFRHDDKKYLIVDISDISCQDE